MSYEGAPEISAFFKRMGVALKVEDDPALGKFVVATADILPDVVDAGKPDAGKVLETTALFEESGIASWATSELLSALSVNYELLAKAREPINEEVLIGYCNESLGLRFSTAANKKSEPSFVSLVPSALFGVDEATTGIVKDLASATSSSNSAVTPFLYSSIEAQQRDTIAASIFGARGALGQLRTFHTNLEKKSAALEHAMIPISVESIARCVVSAVVRFLRALERSLKSQFKGVHPQAPAEKKMTILRELLASVATAPTSAPQTEGSSSAPAPVPSTADSSPTAPNAFVSNLFEASVRPFNRLVEPPEGSEFEASVKTKEWCRVIRNAIRQNAIDVVKVFTCDLIAELSGEGGAKSSAVNTINGLSLESVSVPALNAVAEKNTEVAALKSVLANSSFKSLSVSADNRPTAAEKKYAQLLEWVMPVAEGWFSDATIVTLLGQTTVNAQALTAISASATASEEVVQIEQDDEDDVDEDGNVRKTLVTKSNVCQRVPIFGAAVYTLQSCFNHSCAPNAEVVPSLPFGLGGHDIIVQSIPKGKRISSRGAIAGGGGAAEDEDEEGEAGAAADVKKKSADKKDSKSGDKKKVKPTIKEGEEVNITYIPMLYLALEDYVSRRARLESYFFVCECKRCFRENAKAEKAEAKRRNKEAKHE